MSRSLWTSSRELALRATPRARSCPKSLTRSWLWTLGRAPTLPPSTRGPLPPGPALSKTRAQPGSTVSHAQGTGAGGGVSGCNSSSAEQRVRHDRQLLWGWGWGRGTLTCAFLIHCVKTC